jgi:hypothetical protein
MGRPRLVLAWAAAHAPPPPLTPPAPPPRPVPRCSRFSGSVIYVTYMLYAPYGEHMRRFILHFSRQAGNHAPVLSHSHTCSHVAVSRSLRSRFGSAHRRVGVALGRGRVAPGPAPRPPTGVRSCRHWVRQRHRCCRPAPGPVLAPHRLPRVQLRSRPGSLRAPVRSLRPPRRSHRGRLVLVSGLRLPRLRRAVVVVIVLLLRLRVRLVGVAGARPRQGLRQLGLSAWPGPASAVRAVRAWVGLVLVARPRAAVAFRVVSYM